MKTRPLRAALAITFIGPALAMVPIVLLLLFVYGSRLPWAVASGVLIELIQIILIAGYVVGGVPALIAAAFAAYLIRAKGWIGRRPWWLFTILIGLGSPIFFYVLNLIFSSDTMPLVDFMRLEVFVLPGAIFASLILRLLIVRLGWMRRQTTMAILEVF